MDSHSHFYIIIITTSSTSSFIAIFIYLGRLGPCLVKDGGVTDRLAFVQLGFQLGRNRE